MIIQNSSVHKINLEFSVYFQTSFLVTKERTKTLAFLRRHSFRDNTKKPMSKSASAASQKKEDGNSSQQQKNRKMAHTYWQIRFPEFVFVYQPNDADAVDEVHQQAMAILKAVPLSSLFAIELEDADDGRVYWVYEFSHPTNDFAMPDLPEQVTLRQHHFEDCKCRDCTSPSLKASPAMLRWCKRQRHDRPQEVSEH